MKIEKNWAYDDGIQTGLKEVLRGEKNGEFFSILTQHRLIVITSI